MSILQIAIRYRSRNHQKIATYLVGIQIKQGASLPLASVSVLYDVLNDILVDVSLNPYRYNEKESAKEYIQFLPVFPNSMKSVSIRCSNKIFQITKKLQKSFPLCALIENWADTESTYVNGIQPHKELYLIIYKNTVIQDCYQQETVLFMMQLFKNTALIVLLD